MKWILDAYDRLINTEHVHAMLVTCFDKDINDYAIVAVIGRETERGIYGVPEPMLTGRLELAHFPSLELANKEYGNLVAGLRSDAGFVKVRGGM